MKKYVFLLIISVVLALMAIPFYGGMDEGGSESEEINLLDAQNNPLLKESSDDAIGETEEVTENPFLKPIEEAKEVVEQIPNANPDDYSVEQIPNANPEDFKVEVLPNSTVEFNQSVNLNGSDEASTEEEGFNEVQNEGVTY